jgi:hypothetical protein
VGPECSMNEEEVVMIRIEYDLKGLRTIVYGEISETKLEQFLSGEENFIGITNNKELTWIDKDVILKIEQLQEEEIRFDKEEIIARCKDNHTECLEF